MMVRILAAVALFVLGGMAVATASPVLLFILGIVGVVIQFARRGWRTGLLLLWTAALLAGVLLFLQWAGDTVSWELPLRSVVLFFLLTSATGLAPWAEALRRVRPGSAVFTVVLFLLILRHFVSLLGMETRRMMTARRLAVPRRYGAGWFRSLQRVVISVFRRSLVRAERFYATQALRGLAD